MVRLETDINAVEIHQRAHEQPCADQHHHRQPDLQSDEALGNALPRGASAVRAALLQKRRQIYARGAERGPGAE